MRERERERGRRVCILERGLAQLPRDMLTVRLLGQSTGVCVTASYTNIRHPLGLTGGEEERKDNVPQECITQKHCTSLRLLCS